MNIGILAATFSGNKGAAAMLCSIVDSVSAKHKGATFSILSVYPTEDSKQCYYDNCNIISAKPLEILFKAFPLAILYRLFRWLPFAKTLLVKNKTLRGFYDSDFIIDAAGISFVDSRGFVMNTYNFVCMAIPLLIKKHVIKFSQALGPMDKLYNKIYSNIVLTKIDTICSRGAKTTQYLTQRKLKNIKPCADGGFMLDVKSKHLANILPEIESNPFYKKDFVCISISSVVYSYCQKNNIDYINIIVEFIKYVAKEKNVFILANAARETSQKHKNNDLPICRQIMKSFSGDDRVLFYNKELTPYEIWHLVSLSQAFIGSRFHGMIAALSSDVPVFLVGWSHKYKEVLDEFSLDANAIDYKVLSYKLLINEYKKFMPNLKKYKKSIIANKATVLKSSSQNFVHIEKMITSYCK